MRKAAAFLSGAVDDAGQGGETDEEVGDGESDQTVVRRLLHAFHQVRDTLLTQDDEVQYVSHDAEHAHGQNHFLVDKLFDYLAL